MMVRVALETDAEQLGEVELAARPIVGDEILMLHDGGYFACRVLAVCHEIVADRARFVCKVETFHISSNRPRPLRSGPELCPNGQHACRVIPQAICRCACASCR